jgi:hypothetical protein
LHRSEWFWLILWLDAGKNAEDCRRHTSMLEMGGQHRLRQTAVWVNALLYCQI